MSYQLYDVNGYLGDMATTTGLRDLREFIETKGNKATKGLMELGSSLITDDLIAGLKALVPEDAEVRTTLKNLVSMVNKAELVVIINNGIDGDAE